MNCYLLWYSNNKHFFVYLTISLIPSLKLDFKKYILIFNQHLPGIETVNPEGSYASKSIVFKV